MLEVECPFDFTSNLEIECIPHGSQWPISSNVCTHGHCPMPTLRHQHMQQKRSEDEKKKQYSHSLFSFLFLNLIQNQQTIISKQNPSLRVKVFSFLSFTCWQEQCFLKAAWSSPEVMEAGKFMLSLMNVQSKFILSTLRLPQSLQTNLCPLDMMMSQRH